MLLGSKGMGMPDEELIDSIVENASGPAKATGDSGSIEQHNPKDLIEVDRYQRSVNAAGNTRRGVRFQKIVPPGAD